MSRDVRRTTGIVLMAAGVLLRRRVTSTERSVEIFSNHPNITKRLRALTASEE